MVNSPSIDPILPSLATSAAVDTRPEFEPTKKVMIMLILDILQTETDSDHHLTQKEICERLKTKYGMDAERKAVHRNIMLLVDLGYPINWDKPRSWSKRSRSVKNPETGANEESQVIGEIWYEHPFTPSELRILIDGLLSSKHLSYNQCKKLVGKLARLSSNYFKSRINHIKIMPNNMPMNEQLDLIIATLDDAIERKRKVCFCYLEYGTDKRQHIKLSSNGLPRLYTVSPYQMATKEGKYYLICNHDNHDDIANYRIDRIIDVFILEDQKVRPFSSLKGAGGQKLDLGQYLSEHIFMFSGSGSRCKFRITHSMINDVIDMFGRDITFYDETEEYVYVSARVNERSMLQYAKNYAPNVLILEPKELAEKVCEEAELTIKAYKEVEESGA